MRTRSGFKVHINHTVDATPLPLFSSHPNTVIHSNAVGMLIHSPCHARGRVFRVDHLSGAGTASLSEGQVPLVHLVPVLFPCMGLPVPLLAYQEVWLVCPHSLDKMILCLV